MTISYNLPNFGEIKVNLYGKAKELYELLDEVGLIDKLKITQQLGSIRFAFPGLHHTRYEYVMLQLYMIQFLKSEDDIVEGLKSKIKLEPFIEKFGKEFEEIEEKNLGSKIEFLQILVLLTNIGHFPETFAASKAFLKLIEENKDLKKVYIAGIGKNGKEHLNNVINLGNFYNLHLLNGLFIVKRLKRKNKNLSLLSELILLSFLSRDEFPDNELIYKIFKHIRNFSFLVLDSQYSLVPFNIDLNLISSEIANFYKEFFDESSILNSTFKKLTDILEQSLYFLPKSLKTFYSTYNYLLNKSKEEGIPDIKTVSELKELFFIGDCPKYSLSNLCKYKDLKIKSDEKEREYALYFFIKNNIWKDLYRKLDKMNKYPFLLISPTPHFNKVYISITLKLSDDYSINIYNRLLTIDNIIRKVINKVDENNKDKRLVKKSEERLFKIITTELLCSFFKLDYDKYRIVFNNTESLVYDTPKNLLAEIKNIIKIQNLNRSKENEIKMIKETIEKNFKNKKGKILVYLDSLKIKEKKETEEEKGWKDFMEIDGLIIDFKTNSIFIIEAKKESGGTSISSAKRDIKKKLKKLKIKFDAEKDIKELSKGVYFIFSFF